MKSTARWTALVTMVAGLGLGVTSAQVLAQNSLTHTLVHAADVVVRDGSHYHRNGNFGPGDRLIARRDAYGRTVYYRTITNDAGHDGQGRGNAYRSAYPNAYGNAYQGSYGNSYYGDRPSAYGYSTHGNANGYYRRAPSRHQRAHARVSQRQHNGYDHNGYDRHGYDRNGCDAHGNCRH